MTPETDSSLLRRARLALVLVLLVGAALRILGIGWGLPGETRPDEHPFHPDEEFTYVQAGTLYVTPHPHQFAWGGALYMRFAWAARKAAEAASSGDGVASFRGTLEVLRALNVLFALGAALLLARAGRRLTGPVGGVLAAALFLFAPSHVLSSHYARPDVLCAFLVAASLAVAVKAATDRNRRWILFGAVLGGLAGATMFWGAVSFFPLGVAWLEAGPEGRSRFAPAGIAAGAGIILLGGVMGYVAGSGESLVYFEAYKARWATNPTVGHRGTFRFPVQYVGPLSMFAFGLPAMVAAWAGGLIAVVRRRPGTLAVAVTLLVGFAVLGSQRGYMQRYVLWIGPAVALLAALALTRIRGRLGVGIGVGVAALTLAVSASHVLVMTEGEDVRYRVGRFMAGRSAEGDAAGCPEAYRSDWTYQPRIPPDVSLPLLQFSLRADFDPEAIVAGAPRFLVVSDLARRRCGTPRATRFFELLERGDRYRKVATMGRGSSVVSPAAYLFDSPDDLGYVRPTFHVFERVP